MSNDVADSGCGDDADVVDVEVEIVSLARVIRISLAPLDAAALVVADDVVKLADEFTTVNKNFNRTSKQSRIGIFLLIYQ